MDEKRETHIKRLGIDLGTSSLGWAILDDDRLLSAPTGSAARSPIECGVIVFPEGMAREKGNLKSAAAERRKKRAMRRLIVRRKYRKFAILKLLIENGMCPLAADALKAWQSKGVYPLADKAFMQWLASTPEKNPYADRARAATEKVDAATLGRALYHIAQRRGFKSSRKEMLQELQRQEGEGTSTRAAQDDLGIVKKEIADLTQKLEETGMTLGQYFYSIFGKPGAEGKIRTRRTGRKEHYEKEFDKIAQVQELAPELAKEIRKILFYQRPLRSQRGAVGSCELEKSGRYPRCLEGHPRYELFRALAFLNNLRVSSDAPADPDRPRLAKDEGRPLTPEEHAKILGHLRTRKTALQVGKMGTIDRSLKHLRTNYRADDEFPRMETTARFMACGIPEDKWQMAFDALLDFEDLELLGQWAQKPERLGLSAEAAKQFIRIDPPDERAAYSLHAINLIIPWLERGRNLHDAIAFAKLPSAIPGFEQKADAVVARLDAERAAYKADKAKMEDIFGATGNLYAVKPLRERWKAVIADEFAGDPSKLYIDESAPDYDNPQLPPVDLGSIRNPLANRALTILRKLINTLRKQGRIDSRTIINIELAKSVNSAASCGAVEAVNKANKAQREADAARLREHKLPDDDDETLLRYRLWEEQDHKSVYTGQAIDVADILRCDIEHTVPRSLGGTSKRENLTLCEATFNRDIKRDLLPCECPDQDILWHDGGVLSAWQKKLAELDKECDRARKKAVVVRHSGDADAYAKKRKDYLVLKTKRDYWSEKLRTFRTTREEATQHGFLPRQLAGTGLITRQAVDLLKTRYQKVYPRNGAATSYARKAWGLQKEDEAKERIDHVHHAIDAIVIAALDTARFSAICAELGRDDVRNDWSATCPSPYGDHFGEMIRHAVDGILVRHLRSNAQRRPVTRCARRNSVRLAKPIELRDGTKLSRVKSAGSTVRGSLHNDTLYGKIFEPAGATERVVIRKALAGFSENDKFLSVLEQVVDPAVKAALKSQAQAYLAQDKKTKLFAQTYWMNAEKRIPIQKVRIFVGNVADPDALRRQVFTKPGKAGQLHGSVYVSGSDLLSMDIPATGSPCIVSLLDKARGRAADGNGQLAIYPEQLALAYDQSPNELRALTEVQLAKRLYVVRKTEEGRATFRYHREARPATILAAALAEAGDSSKGQTSVNAQEPVPLLRLSASYIRSHMAFEGVSFRLDLSGRIEWLDD